jgi:hypothetical protein
LLNPGASVGFEDMEPASDQIRLHARSFGVRMSAAANLSQCQLNCLGLSVWMMRATTPGSPFGFIVLDDPIHSMDDDHCEAFMDSVLPHLMDAQVSFGTTTPDLRAPCVQNWSFGIQREIARNTVF